MFWKAERYSCLRFRMSVTSLEVASTLWMGLEWAGGVWSWGFYGGYLWIRILSGYLWSGFSAPSSFKSLFLKSTLSEKENLGR